MDPGAAVNENVSMNHGNLCPHTSLNALLPWEKGCAQIPQATIENMLLATFHVGNEETIQHYRHSTHRNKGFLNSLEDGRK